jgi:surface-anchored protein
MKRHKETVMKRTLAIAVAATAIAAWPARAQFAGNNMYPILTIARIFHNGPLQMGSNTLRITVRNGNQVAPTPQGEPVVVKLIVLDPDQHRSEYQSQIPSGIGINSDQTAAIQGVTFSKPGSYTVTAQASLPPQAGRPDIKSPDRTEVFAVGGAQAAAANQLIVQVRRQATNMPVGGVRVSLKADNRELDWKQTTSAGEARFTRVAPSPAGKTYVIEVKFGNQMLGAFDYSMPAQAAVFEAKVQ